MPTDEAQKADLAPMTAAVAAGDWPEVLRLWNHYAAPIMDEIRCGTCTPARMAEAGEFLHWAERTVLCARAQAQLCLDRLYAAGQYAPQPESRSTSLHTNG